MARQGVILLGYARSAGSGDQPIAGTVTSRRDRGQQQRQKLLKQQQLEEERLVRQRQELAAQFLKKKWREQDIKRKEDVSAAHYDSEEDEREIRQRARERAKPPKVESAPESIETTQRSEQPSLQEGKWVSVGGGAPCQQRDPATGSRAPEASRQISISAKPVAMPADDPRQKQRKKALASAFKVDEEEDVEARRELELAAKIKKARVEAREARVAEQVVVDTRPAAPAAPPAPKPMDMYEQMKKLAEWKRSCKGNRRPMPDDMVRAIAQSSGLAAPEASAASSASSSRRRSRSRSRSGSGGRRFLESQSRRSERGRSERESTRSRRSSRQSRSGSRGSRAATRCVL